MKADIRQTGVLEIIAETEIEKYALEKWCIDNVKDDILKLEKTLFYWGDKDDLELSREKELGGQSN